MQLHRGEFFFLSFLALCIHFYRKQTWRCDAPESVHELCPLVPIVRHGKYENESLCCVLSEKQVLCMYVGGVIMWPGLVLSLGRRKNKRHFCRPVERTLNIHILEFTHRTAFVDQWISPSLSTTL